MKIKTKKAIKCNSEKEDSTIDGSELILIGEMTFNRSIEGYEDIKMSYVYLTSDLVPVLILDRKVCNITEGLEIEVKEEDTLRMISDYQELLKDLKIYEI